MSQSYIILAQVMPIEIDLQRRPIALGWSFNRFLGNLLAHAADRKRDGGNHEDLQTLSSLDYIMEGGRDRTR